MRRTLLTATTLITLMGSTFLASAQETFCVYEVEDLIPGGSGAFPTSMIEYDGELIFKAAEIATGYELYKFDGTSISLIEDINPGPGNSQPNEFIVYDGNLYFSATNGSNGTELWVYDGTSVSMVADINAGIGHSFPQQMLVHEGELFFVANDGIVGTEMWKYDGVAVTLVDDIYPGIGTSSILDMTTYGTDLYFTADDGVVGRELWMYDGTSVSLVADINVGAATSMIGELREVGAELVFRANNGSDGNELFKYDGTTVTMMEINPGFWNSNPTGFCVVGSTLYMRAFESVAGYEFWQYDGTTPSLVEDINPGSSNSFPDKLTNVGGVLYFTADNGADGREVWKYDGVTVEMVIDLAPGALSSDPEAYFEIAGDVYFIANDNSIGVEIYRYDGTDVVLGKDIYPGGNSSNPADLENIGADLYFSAEDGSDGVELWCWKTDMDVTSELTEVSCGPYTAPSGTVHTTVGTYTITDTIPSVICPQCDSIITIDLTLSDADDPFFEYTTDTYCQADDDPFPSTIATPGGTFSIAPGGGVIYPTTGQVDLSLSFLGTYTIKYITPICPDSSTFTITILESEDPDVEYFKYAWCKSEENPSPTAISTPGGVFSSSPAGLSINSSTGEINIAGSTPGSYTIKYVTTGACNDSIEFTMDIDEINTDVTSSGNLLTAALAGVEYQWLHCDFDFFPIFDANNQSYYAPTSGSYAVEITDGACKDTSECITVIDPSGIGEENGAFVQFYPNPVTEYLTILQPAEQDVLIRLMDNTGKLLQQVSTSESETVLDLSLFAEGIYYVSVSNDQFSLLEQIVKQ